MKSCEWWEPPKTNDEIDAHLDRVFKHAGDQTWLKLVRQALKESLERVLDGNEAYVEVKDK